ncbi:MAG: 7-carboxy-7-deazaguanine synthase QueE [Chitinophagaceae bacterium]|nr:7-carboxy-7-deazaguanine synthase QueE [Chitinophagaceae bacterium]
MKESLQHTTISLPVMEHFYTLQGEGYHQGRAAYFIRLGGCDVGCVWCDVKDSWETDKHPKYSIEYLINQVKKTSAEMVVITGGEPLMHNLDELTEEFQTAGLKTHIETSGAHPLSGQWDWICLSPKKFKAPLKPILHLAHELKVVIFNQSDFDWAKNMLLLFLQPANCTCNLNGIKPHK